LKNNKKKPASAETGDKKVNPEIINSAKIAKKVFEPDKPDEKTENK